jgi:hypothetical protein
MANFIEKTVDGMVQAVSAEFEYKVYTEFVEQGMKGPCFFIGCISSSETDGLNERFRVRCLRRHDMQVIVFPEKDKYSNAELYNAVSEKLYTVLKEITIDGDRVRGIERRHEIADGVLVFYVSYEIPIVRIDDNRDYMKELEMM